MKRTKYLSLLLLSIVLTGCGEGNRHPAVDFITVDVTVKYPEKELILQDVMDVEYIALETSDEFITKGVVQAVGKDWLLVTNQQDGDIFVFDRKTGKGVRKINRSGQGGEEYSQLNEIVLDEDARELFVKDYAAQKILVYDLEGNFKRTFRFADTGYYDYLYNYDREHLITYKTYLPMDTEEAGHVLISKQDGSIVREIPIPFQAIKTPKWISDDLQITPFFFLTAPYPGNWLLANASSDTIYTYSQDNILHPLLVRTPSIHTMETEIFLFPGAVTGRYYFMNTLKKEVDLTTFKGFPGTDLVYDKQEKALFSYTLLNDDFANRKQVSFRAKPISQEIAIYQSLEAFDLVEAYENNQLKGKLKEIAAGLDEESNPVIMLVKYRE